MGWIPGWPTDPTDPKGSLNPAALTLHRTYGGWPGDYSVGKQGIFQFLIGKEDGQYVQFMSTTSVAWHCNGSNFRSVGVELTGTNEDRLTDWQVTKLGELLRYMHAEHGIPLSYQDPITTPPASISVNHSNFTGVIAHVSVATDDGSTQHGDYVTVPDYLRALGKPPPTPALHKEDKMIYVGPLFGRIGNVAWLCAGSLILHEWTDADGGSGFVGPKKMENWNDAVGHHFDVKLLDAKMMQVLHDGHQ